MTSQAILIFTKNAEKGKVKTRLAASIGIDEAFAVNQRLVDHTLRITADLSFDKFLFYSDYIPAEESIKSYRLEIQQGVNLGERMSQAFAAVFEMGYESVVIIGTDCPELNSDILMDSFAGLEDNDVVIGPAADGGYYLIGMKRQIPELFSNISWSTSTVCTDTLSICKSLSLTCFLLPVLHDVDEVLDLIYLQSLNK